MKTKLKNLVLFKFALLLVLGGTTILDAQVLSRANTRQVQNLLVRIETKTDVFKDEVDRSLDRSRIDDTNTEDSINNYISNFETATDALRSRFNARQDVSAETTEVLNRATVIDTFMRTNRLSASAERQWTSLRTDLNMLARYYSLTWNWNQTIPGRFPSTSYTIPYTVSELQVRTLLTRIESKTDRYKRQLDSALDRSRLNDTNREDSISDYVTEFENATDRLKEKFDNDQSVGGDVSEVLTRASYIDQFMRRNRLSTAAVTQWSSLRTDLNTLANYYRVSSNWNQTLPPFTAGIINRGGVHVGTEPGTRFDARLTGTYRLSPTESDNISEIINRALRNYPVAQRENVRRNLERRLQSPEVIAVEKEGRMVTMASSTSPQLSFEADGAPRTETNNRGRVITTTATADRQDGLTISYQGERMNDFYASFRRTPDGHLHVTRRVYVENLDQQITVSSTYDKISNTAQWPGIDNRTIGNDNVGIGNSGSFVIPNGTQITAVLRDSITTRDSKVNDRFTMEVTSPGQFAGAMITGRVAASDSSGRVSGRSNLSLDFESIRLNNGETYRFAGLVDGVTAVNGDDVTVNNEGTVRDSNQTTKTVTRAGIGAALGALIGAIAGGGSGAAVGAAVGAGAGAGSVLLQGRDNINLSEGSTFRITATAPNNVGTIRN